MKENQNLYLNEKQVHDLTGIGLSTLRNHRSMKKGIPYIKISRSVKYSMEDVLQFMESHKIRFDVGPE